MNIFICLTFAAIFFVHVCLTQSINDDFGFVPAALSDAIGSVQGVAATIANHGTSSTVETPASTPQTPATTSTPSTSPTTSTSTPTSTTTSTSSSKSSTLSTAKASSSTSSAAKSSSSTSSTAKASSTVAPQAHHSSTKIGVGVGVSLGIVSLALIGFLILRHLRYKKDSRLRHHGIIAAAGLYPVNDESDNNARETGHENMADAGNESEGFEKNDVHEIQGTEIPAYSRELIGSPGVQRQELGSRHGYI